MKLIPIKETLEQNKEYTNDPVYKKIIEMTIRISKKSWICVTMDWLSGQTK